MEPSLPGSPILYYAMGGGLGHLSRTLAIADELGPFASSIRILGSSNLAPMVLASTGYTIDYITEDKLVSKESYYGFLSAYIEQHQFASIIVDTFPFGIVGEWLTLAKDVPKLLIARSLIWDRYADIINIKKNNCIREYPTRTLAIEPLDIDYEAVLTGHSAVAYLHEPILQGRSRQRGSDESEGLVNRCAVVHSGNQNERDLLLGYAKKLFLEKNISVPIDTLFPDQKIYPANDLLSSYKYIISGAGYNMAAMASQAGPSRHHYLFPFTRKFDDQHARKKNVESGLWKNSEPDGACKAARWITGHVINYLTGPGDMRNQTLSGR